jgi:hypothetical protein
MGGADHRSRTYEIAYNEAIRLLAEQRAALDNLRTRAGVVLSAAAIATSFLGQNALTSHLSAWDWLAICSFAGLGGLCLSMLWPREEETLSLSPRNLIRTYAEAERPVPVDRVHRDLAYHAEARYGQNEMARRLLEVYLRGANALLSVEVLAWIVDLLIRT